MREKGVEGGIKLWKGNVRKVIFLLWVLFKEEEGLEGGKDQRTHVVACEEAKMISWIREKHVEGFG